MSVGWATGREILSRHVKQSEGARGCQGSDEGLAPGTSFPGERIPSLREGSCQDSFFWNESLLEPVGHERDCVPRHALRGSALGILMVALRDENLRRKLHGQSSRSDEGRPVNFQAPLPAGRLEHHQWRLELSPRLIA